jgi:hypothetical protein
MRVREKYQRCSPRLHATSRQRGNLYLHQGLTADKPRIRRSQGTAARTVSSGRACGRARFERVIVAFSAHCGDRAVACSDPSRDRIDRDLERDKPQSNVGFEAPMRGISSEKEIDAALQVIRRPCRRPRARAVYPVGKYKRLAPAADSTLVASSSRQHPFSVRTSAVGGPVEGHSSPP